MTMTHNKQATREGARPAPPWPPDGPGGPGGTDEKPSGWLHRPHRRVLAAAAVAVIAVAAGGGIAYGTSGGPATLTTAQITAKTDPGVVDVVATDGYEHSTSAARGSC
jgi:hypothetical protein